MAKIYKRPLSTIIVQGGGKDSFAPQNQTLSGEDSTRMVDRLEIPHVVDCYFFYYTIDLLWLFHNRSFVLSSDRKNQIVDTIGTLLHDIHVEFYMGMPCLLSTAFLTYFLEIKEEA